MTTSKDVAHLYLGCRVRYTSTHKPIDGQEYTEQVETTLTAANLNEILKRDDVKLILWRWQNLPFDDRFAIRSAFADSATSVIRHAPSVLKACSTYHIDLFNLIDNGQAINAAMINKAKP